ncbi:solute carrier family 22 member 13-like [Plectropomus leopardus]|uniref:solute carrier family 22 member 13-like n=1 Tax=Plectropomus leopardus TaxID=160734 RepID=UPI001C4AE4E4|nr:solute carrier family 22 member 13-like [Plectropomus leopardus]
MFVPVDWDIGAIREYGLNETTGCQNGWVYYNTLYESTIVTDFDLVCDRANFVGLAQMVLMGGILLGSFVFGPVTESFGRKRATQITTLIILIFQLTTALSPNVYFFFASHFMLGFGSGGYRVSSVILTTEWIGPSRRSWGAIMSQLINAVGQCIAAGVIYLIRQWRVIQFITVAPPAVTLTYLWFIPESARWLLSRGWTEEASQLIIKVAAINKRPVPDTLLENMVVKEDVKKKGGIKVIFRSPALTKYFGILTLGWFALNLAFLCLYFNMRNLGFNIFITQLLFGATEILANLLCVWLLEVFGRKLLLVATLMMGGLACLLILAVPQENGTAVTSLAVAARFFLVGGVCVCNVYVQELFPTSARQTATALGAMIGRSGAVVAPLLNMLAVYHRAIPIAVYGSLAAVSGALCFLLPETRRKELPESAEEVENNRNETSEE